MKQKLVSIIIPAYNIEDYLPSTLDSVLAQTHSNIEVIIVNDGSSDGTGDIVDHYVAMDNRVRAIHKENGGVTSARLRGVAEANGEWIGFVDGDDFIEPQMYERLLGNALKYGADISHCGYQMVFPSRVDYYYNTGRLVEQNCVTGLRDLLSGDFVEPGLCNKLYRRELVDGLAEHVDPTIHINEDLLMNYWLFKAAKLSVFEDVCPYHYVLRSGSAATSEINAHKLHDPLRVLRLLLRDADDAVRPVLIPRLTRQLIAGATMPSGDQRKLIIPFRKECHRELCQELFTILACRECSVKLKIMALWVTILPSSYSWTHRIYAKISGIDKKYDIR